MSIVFIDLKGEPAAFWALFDAAHRAKLPFKYFSPVLGDESFIFNPLRQRFQKKLTVGQKSEWMAQAGGMDHGEIYGGAFFLGKSELVLSHFFANYTNPPIENFEELFRLFNDRHSYTRIGHIEDYVDASHFRSLFARLASISSVNATPRSHAKESAHTAAIDASDFFRTPTICYFKCPASIGRNASRFLGRAMAQSLYAAGVLRAPDEKIRVFVAIDEFQELIAGIEAFLEQCRSRGIAVGLFHQSIGQLERNDLKLLPVVQACTSTHFVIEASDAETVEYVQKRSGQAYFGLTSWSQEAPASDTEAFYSGEFFAPWRAATADGLGTPLMNVREELGYRANENLIRRVSADSLSAFVVMKKNEGLANYDGAMFPMRVYHHIEKSLFERRDKEPWPTWERPETIIVSEINPFVSKAATGPIQVVPPPPAAIDSLRDCLRKRARDSQ